MARKSNQQQETVRTEISESNEQVTVVEELPVDHFTYIVREGKAKSYHRKPRTVCSMKSLFMMKTTSSIFVCLEIRGWFAQQGMDPA